MHNLTQYGLAGFYNWEEISPEGEIVNKSPNKNNLILNQGLQYVTQFSFAECFQNVVIGQSGIAPLYTDSGLNAEFARSNTIESKISNPCGTSLTGNIYSMYRTFTIGPFHQPVFIREIGWSHFSTPGNNLTSRAQIVTTDGNIGELLLGSYNYLRVKYTLQVSLGPTSPLLSPVNIIGNNTIISGYSQIQYIGLRSINSDGSLGYFDSGLDCNEPSAKSYAFLGESSAALASFGSANDRSAGNNSVQPCSNIIIKPGVISKEAIFTRNQSASSILRSYGIGAGSTPYNQAGYVVLTTGNLTKDSNNILIQRIVYSCFQS